MILMCTVEELIDRISTKHFNSALKSAELDLMHYTPKSECIWPKNWEQGRGPLQPKFGGICLLSHSGRAHSCIKWVSSFQAISSRRRS